MNEPLTDGVIGPKITLGEFRTMTSRFPADTVIMVEHVAGMDPVLAHKLQVVYSELDVNDGPTVVIA